MRTIRGTSDGFLYQSLVELKETSFIFSISQMVVILLGHGVHIFGIYPHSYFYTYCWVKEVAVVMHWLHPSLQPKGDFPRVLLL